MTPRINAFDWFALFIVILGALNWGFVGLLDMNIVTEVFGNNLPAQKTIYLLQGLSGLYLTYFAFKMAG